MIPLNFSGSRYQPFELPIVGTSANLQALLTAAGTGATVNVPAGRYTLAYNASPITPLNNQTINASNVMIDGTSLLSFSSSGYANVYQATVAGFTTLRTTNCWCGRVIDSKSEKTGLFPFSARYHKVAEERRDAWWGEYSTSEWWAASAYDTNAKTITVNASDRAEFVSAMQGHAANEFTLALYQSGTNGSTYSAIVSYNVDTGVVTFADSFTMGGTVYFTLANHPCLISLPGEYSINGTTVYYRPYLDLDGIRVVVAGQAWSNNGQVVTVNNLTVRGSVGAPSTGYAFRIANAPASEYTGLTLLYTGRLDVSESDNIQIANLRVENTMDRGALIYNSPGGRLDKSFFRRNWVGTALSVWGYEPSAANFVVERAMLLRSGGSHSNAISIYEVNDGDNCDGVEIIGTLIADPINLGIVSNSRSNLSAEVIIRNCLIIDQRTTITTPANAFRQGTYANDLICKFLNNTAFGGYWMLDAFEHRTNRAGMTANCIIGSPLYYNAGAQHTNQGYNLFHHLGGVYAPGYANTDDSVANAALAFTDPDMFDFTPLIANGGSDGGDQGCRWNKWPDLSGGIDSLDPSFMDGLTYSYDPAPTTQLVGAGTDNR